ncbi:hypothetical protein llap_8664 [Limosa lapponica baueri]|uniref:Uncharacterized protein n=1 Tax=Limosa lapponica baueri TaxID=1758121 RepID=A0A2I0U4Q3_LIMLA|nr:hypothetical protein llap_8664 [Limosa lapponica baueri]
MKMQRISLLSSGEGLKIQHSTYILHPSSKNTTQQKNFLPASLNGYTNDVNTYRTIADRELISTKYTGACVDREIPKK